MTTPTKEQRVVNVMEHGARTLADAERLLGLVVEDLRAARGALELLGKDAPTKVTDLDAELFTLTQAVLVYRECLDDLRLAGGQAASAPPTEPSAG